MEQSVKSIIVDGLGMPRLEQVDVSGVMEDEFESTVIRLLRRIHTSCHVFRFKPPVIDPDNVVWKPDIAILHEGREYFGIIEIERYTKSFDKHVLPQVIGLRDGSYGEAAAAAMSDLLGIQLEEAKTILHCVPRFVAVIVNGEVQDWRTKLASENIQMLSITKFGEEGGTVVHLVEGQLHSYVRSIGVGTVHATEQAIRIKKSAFWVEGRQYSIITGDGRSNWTSYNDGPAVLLIKDRGVVTVPNGKFVQFLLSDDDTISLRVL